jgi:hypothetical protein
MTEFRCSASFISRGYSVIAFEEEGFLDFKATSLDGKKEFLFDCKRINKDSNNKRYKSVIEKANKQFKRYDNHTEEDLPGIVYVSTPIVEYRNPKKFPGTVSTTPSSLMALKEEVEKVISTSYTSVNGVFLSWSEKTIVGKLNSFVSGAVLQGLVGSVFVKHKQPKCACRIKFEELKLCASLIRVSARKMGLCHAVGMT